MHHILLNCIFFFFNRFFFFQARHFYFLIHPSVCSIMAWSLSPLLPLLCICDMAWHECMTRTWHSPQEYVNMCIYIFSLSAQIWIDRCMHWCVCRESVHTKHAANTQKCTASYSNWSSSCLVGRLPHSFSSTTTRSMWPTLVCGIWVCIDLLGRGDNWHTHSHLQQQGLNCGQH